MYASNWKPEYPGDKLPLLSMGTCRAVDFCVWVLQVDGLHAAPFSSHDEGDHSLRDAGLTPDGWRRWLGRVIAAYMQVDMLIQQLFEARAAPTYLIFPPTAALVTTSTGDPHGDEAAAMALAAARALANVNDPGQAE